MKNVICGDSLCLIVDLCMRSSWVVIYSVKVNGGFSFDSSFCLMMNLFNVMMFFMVVWYFCEVLNEGVKIGDFVVGYVVDECRCIIVVWYVVCNIIYL